jgi:bifunctional DNA-binding transcriptional regulator/antitoxin component of YhaV-PrlF toxin-antitoxin module
MKLQKQKAWTYKDTEYAKYSIVIPNKEIDKLGWKEGDELESIIKGEKLVIAKKTPKQIEINTPLFGN